MQPWQIVDRAPAPGGQELILARRGGEWAIRIGGEIIMSSRAHASEEALAARALEQAAGSRAVLIGGLGLGYTLRASLDRLPRNARVVVAELSSQVVAWNRGPLAALAGHPLDDPRARVRVEDVASVVREASDRWDAILLDVDNGPRLGATGGSLYSPDGLRACLSALRPGGVLGIWSAAPDLPFRDFMREMGFFAEMISLPATGTKGTRHALFLGARAVRPPTPGRSRSGPRRGSKSLGSRKNEGGPRQRRRPGQR